LNVAAMHQVSCQ